MGHRHAGTRTRSGNRPCGESPAEKRIGNKPARLYAAPQASGDPTDACPFLFWFRFRLITFLSQKREKQVPSVQFVCYFSNDALPFTSLMTAELHQQIATHIGAEKMRAGGGRG